MIITTSLIIKAGIFACKALASSGASPIVKAAAAEHTLHQSQQALQQSIQEMFPPVPEWIDEDLLDTLSNLLQ